MQRVRRRTLIDQVTEQLRREIVSGNWSVGTRIPTEPELCELTGTARNTVREAVQALAHAGMVERRQGSGTYVISAADQALSEYFGRARDTDLLELRETLEVTAAALAAERRTEADVAVLTELLGRRLGARDDDEFTTSDAELHRAIVAASHNEIYLEFYDSLLPRVAAAIVRHLAFSQSPLNAEHEALVRAVLDGEADAARDAAQALAKEVRETAAPAG